jgi:hypothetical protein
MQFTSEQVKVQHLGHLGLVASTTLSVTLQGARLAVFVNEVVA